MNKSNHKGDWVHSIERQKGAILDRLEKNVIATMNEKSARIVDVRSREIEVVGKIVCKMF